MTGADYQICPARETDASALLRLNAAFNGAGCTDGEALLAALRDNPAELVVVAALEGKLVGFCCVQVYRSICYAGPVAELTEMYVVPRHRRLGLGRGMIALAEDMLRARGVRSLHLLTGRDNLAAQRLYAAAGFAMGGEVFMEKALR